MQILHGYKLDEKQWKSLGGNGQCVIATKGDKQYFIKRLNKPKYPESDYFTDDFKQQKINECQEWLQTRKAIADTLPGTGSGNIIKPLEYFREKSCFYEVTNVVDVTSIPHTDIWKLPKDDKVRMMITITKSLSDIHKAGIVHGDLDPGNILISKSTAGKLITKIIDFTDAFFADDPPEFIMSKDAWWSPEVALYSKTKERPNPVRKYISCQSDVYSLGLIFHQYCTEGGTFPEHTEDYTWQALAKGKSLTIDSNIEPELGELIRSMLNIEPEDRPSMEEIHQKLLCMSGKLVDNRKSGEIDSKTLDASKGSGIMLCVGPGKKKNGTVAISAELIARNKERVEVTFSDHQKQIMPLRLAVRQGFVLEQD